MAENDEQVSGFLDGTGASKLIWYYQVPEELNENGELVQVGTDPTLQLTSGDTDRITGKAVYFIRQNPKGVSEKTIDADVTVGEVLAGALESYKALVTDLFLPILKEQGNWGKSSEENTQEFLTGTARFGGTLNEAVNSLQGGIELKKPDKKYGDLELKPQVFNKAAQDSETADHFELVLEDWCAQTEKLLEEGGEGNRMDGDESGPDTELEFWRTRMSKFNSITEQLKTKECKLVLGVCMSARSKAHRQWKNIDVKVTDAANEAKDNVKYLSTLEKSLEPMYLGNPQAIIDSLPGLMNNIKMMHTIARYYNTPERMTTLFCKITNQMINNCKQFITAPGKLWDQEKLALLENLKVALRLNEVYKEQYKPPRTPRAPCLFQGRSRNSAGHFSRGQSRGPLPLRLPAGGGRAAVRGVLRLQGPAGGRASRPPPPPPGGRAADGRAGQSTARGP